MKYHYLKDAPEIEALESLNVHDATDAGLLQWHRDDYTLVAQTEYSIVGRLRSASSKLTIGEDVHRIEYMREARKLVLDAADHAVVGESDQGARVVWYGFSDVQMVERRAFADEATDLVESFVNAMVALVAEIETPEHRALVQSFNLSLAEFLGAYRNLSLDDVARYVSNVGVAPDKARHDLDLLLHLYA